MKKILLNAFILIAGVSLALLSGCQFRCVNGSGRVVTENRQMSDFTKIDVTGSFKIILVQDSSLTLHITTDDNLFKYINTSVDGDKLKISNKNICNSAGQTITIGVRNLKELHATGAVEVASNGKINADEISLRLSGATKVTLDLNAGRVITKGTGSTEVNLKGQASTHDVNLSGSGNLNALDFIVGDYNISSSGSSDCSINVLRELNVHSSGSSAIKYRGTPTQINNSKSGSSSIEKVN